MRAIDLATWAFHPGDEPDAWKAGFDDAGWRRVEVPHDWSIERPFAEEHSSGTGYLPGGVGWYRARVPFPEAAHLRLVFHGVYKNARVWVNGYHLGGRASGHAEFSFDLTEIAAYAAVPDLVVAVRVDHSDISDSRWYNGSGLTRGAELQLHGSVRLRHRGTAFATLAADDRMARVRVAHTVEGDVEADVVVRSTLRSLSDGRVVDLGEATRAIRLGTSTEVVFEADVPDPVLWSESAPSLHALETTLTPADGESARYEEIVGIRTLRFDADAGFSLGGVPTTLRGVCLHEDAGPFGTAVPAAVWLRRLLALRRLGANAVRMAHNPHAQELYSLCDALGMLVVDEAFDEWENPKNKWWQGHNVYPPRHEGAAEHFPQTHEDDLRAMIAAHRGHPSVIAWSIGNEIDYPNDPYASPLFDEMTGNNDASKPVAERVYDATRPDIRRLSTIARRLAGIARDEDPTRPVTLAAAFPELSSRTGLLDAIDVAGYNYKEHLYRDDHERFPRLPLLGSENGHGYLQWRAVVDDAFVAGQFLWTGIDYLGEAHGWPVHGSGAGLLTLAGFEKPTAALRRSWWSDEPVAALAARPHARGEQTTFWTHPVSRAWEGEGPHEVLCFSNGEPRLTRGGADVPLRRDDEEGYWTAVVEPGEPIVLETLADGAVVARDELRARGDAVRLDAAVWRAPGDVAAACRAAGVGLDGVQQIEVTLRDASGGPARGERMVAARVDGGRLVGLENGDLADPTPYSAVSRRTLDGRLAVFVRADGPGRVVLSAPGLDDVEVAW